MRMARSRYHARAPAKSARIAKKSRKLSGRSRARTRAYTGFGGSIAADAHRRASRPQVQAFLP
jgi:hypothetical protein